MSRSGYSDDIAVNYWQHIMWRGRVASAIRGKRGQKLLRELAAAMDAMPEKTLTAHELISTDGEYCALGVVGACRGIDLSKLDPEDYDAVAAAFDIAAPLAQEIVYENDEIVKDYVFEEVEICGPIRQSYREWGSHTKTVRVTVDSGPRRWLHMRKWVEANLRGHNNERTKV